MPSHRMIKLLVGTSALALPVGLLAAPASAETRGAVKGIVTLAGQPLAGASVTLQRTANDEDYSNYKRVKTDANGSYSFASRPKSEDYTYRVVVSDSQHRIVKTARDLNNRTTKTVTRNVTAKAAGSISGKLTRADGSAASLSEVQLVGPETLVGSGLYAELAYDTFADPAADGSYRFVGLPAGKYTVGFIDDGEKYLSKCFDDAIATIRLDYPCSANGTPVTVTGGTNTTLSDQQLDQIGGTFRGTVTDTSGKPLRNIMVTPIAAGETQWGFYLSDDTRKTGRFNHQRVEPGKWQLRFTDTSGKYATTWFNTGTRTGAQVFDVADRSVFKDLVIKLKSAAKLSVKAKPGDGKPTFTVNVTRRVSGGRPSGKITVSYGDRSRTVSVKKGVAKVTLTGLKAGKRKIRVAYKGTANTADAHKNVSVRVR